MSALGVNVGQTGGSMLGDSIAVMKGMNLIKSGGNMFSNMNSKSSYGSGDNSAKFLQGGLAGAIGRKINNSGINSATGNNNNPLTNTMFESSLNKNGSFSQDIVSQVATGEFGKTGSITGDKTAQALSSYMNYDASTNSATEITLDGVNSILNVSGSNPSTAADAPLSAGNTEITTQPEQNIAENTSPPEGFTIGNTPFSSVPDDENITTLGQDDFKEIERTNSSSNEMMNASQILSDSFISSGGDSGQAHLNVDTSNNDSINISSSSQEANAIEIWNGSDVTSLGINPENYESISISEGLESDAAPILNQPFTDLSIFESGAGIATPDLESSQLSPLDSGNEISAEPISNILDNPSPETEITQITGDTLSIHKTTEPLSTETFAPDFESAMPDSSITMEPQNTI